MSCPMATFRVGVPSLVAAVSEAGGLGTLTCLPVVLLFAN